MATLTRITSIEQIPDSLAELDEQLAIDAERLLGYTAASKANAPARQNAVRKDIYARLLKLGIQPFQQDSVDRYKTKKENSRWWKWLLTGLAVWAVTTTLSRIFGHGSFSGSVFLGGAVGVLGWVFAGAVLQPANWEWRSRPVYGYDRPIPAHVLQTALMRREFSRASLDIHEFVRKEQQPIIDDPFLVMTQEGVTVTLAVWDEPTFKDK